jgi:hypothetical protein
MPDNIDLSFEVLATLVNRAVAHHKSADQPDHAKKTGIDLVVETQEQLLLIKSLVRKIEQGSLMYASSARHLLYSARRRATIAAQWIIDENVKQKFVSAVSVCISELEIVLNKIAPDSNDAPEHEVVEFERDKAHLLCASCGRVSSLVQGKNATLALSGDFKAISANRSKTITPPHICTECNKSYCKEHFACKTIEKSLPFMVVECTCPHGHKTKKKISLPI